MFRNDKIDLEIVSWNNILVKFLHYIDLEM